MAIKKRMIGIPQATATQAPGGSSITGGTSSILPKDTAPKINNIATPPSVSNPSSLKPGTQPKTFSDNMTKPILDTPPIQKQPPVIKTQQPQAPSTTQEPIGQNVDGSFIYGGTQSTTPSITPTETPIVTPSTSITSPKPEFSGSLYDPNNYLGSGKTKNEFTAMNISDQQNLINQAVSNVEERQAIMDQVKVYAENKAQQEYQTKQNQIRTGIDQAQTTSAEIQASQRIREAQTNLDNLKQNLGFLGTGGRPMKSATAIEGASRMLMQSEQTFNELKKIEEEYKAMRDSGVEFNANAFEEQMRILEKQLTDNVDASIIQAMQGFNSEAALASIDTPKKLFDLQQKYLDMIDTSVEGITNRQVNEMKNLQTRYADYAKQYAEDLKQRQEQQALTLKNKNTLNEAMSKALGYYVDGNGSPLQTTDGQVIEYKNEADKPIIDRATGKVAYFNTDANGNQVVEIKQLFTPEQKAPNIQKVGVGANGEDIYGYYDQATGGVKTVSAPAMTGGLGDLRSLASQFPGQARAKNNNPAGMKSSISDRTKQLMVDAGVQRATGSTPPPNEGGRYMQFATIEDGLLAHKVLLTKAGSDDINARLQQRVGTAEGPRYAAQLMGQAGIPNGTKFSQLSEEQLDKLLFAQIQKESPGLAKLLQQGAATTNKKLSPEKQTAIQDALYAIEDLENTGGKSSAVGYSVEKYLPGRIKPGEGQFVPGSEAANFEAKFNRLRDMLTLPNLDKLKGAMSDKDIAFLRNASTALNLNMTEKEFDRTLQQVKEKFQGMLGVQPTQTTTNTTGGGRRQG